MIYLPMSGVRHCLSLCRSEHRPDLVQEAEDNRRHSCFTQLTPALFCVTPSRNHTRPHTTLCLVAKEDCRGVRRRLVQHAYFWLLREYSPLSSIAFVLIRRWQWGSFWMRYEYMICTVKDLCTNM